MTWSILQLFVWIVSVKTSKEYQFLPMWRLPGILLMPLWLLIVWASIRKCSCNGRIRFSSAVCTSVFAPAKLILLLNNVSYLNLVFPYRAFLKGRWMSSRAVSVIDCTFCGYCHNVLLHASSHYSAHTWQCVGILTVDELLTLETPKRVWNICVNLDIAVTSLYWFRSNRRWKRKGMCLFSSFIW